MKYSSEQATRGAPSQTQGAQVDRILRLHPAVGVVCPRCGARIGKPCVSTVPALGFGVVGGPIEGVHAERIADALARSCP